MNQNKLCVPVDVDETFAKNPCAWLADQATDLCWLLAHADDGVIWGRRKADGKLTLSSEVFSNPAHYPTVAVKLRACTLQQLRLFGPKGELFLWRKNEGFVARLIQDKERPEHALPDERMLLWGTRVAENENGFALLVEGQQGLYHAPPFKDLTKLDETKKERVAIRVRHYLAFDEETGQARIALSRLVTLENPDGTEA